MTQGREVRALRWSCQAWRHAGPEDRRTHAVDAARSAWRLGADAARVADLGLVDHEDAREILGVAADDDALLVEECFTRWFAGDRESALQMLHPQAQIVNDAEGRVLHGMAELRAHLATTDEPAELALTLDEAAERDGTVLITAIADVRRVADGAVERLLPGWVCEVADGMIVRVTTYLDCGVARTAAFGGQVPPRRILRDTRSWYFARSRNVPRPRLA